MLSESRTITVEEVQITIGPMDVVAGPGDVFHGTMNVGAAVGFMLSINMGAHTPRYTMHSAILEELGMAQS